MQKQIILSLALLLPCHYLNAQEAPRIAATEPLVTPETKVTAAAETQKATAAVLRKKVIEAEATTPLLPDDAKEEKIDEAPLTTEQEAKKRGLDYGTVKEINKPRGQ